MKGIYINKSLGAKGIMDIREIDAMELKEPLKGIKIKRWFGDLGELKSVLRALLARRALVCISPNRRERCDRPATGIFWQDGCEWYPCCDEHWPSGPQWTGSTRFRGGQIAIHCFHERCTLDDGIGSAFVEKYDRANAT